MSLISLYEVSQKQAILTKTLGFPLSARYCRRNAYTRLRFC